MAMLFEELDDATRRYMLEEFLSEQASVAPYRGANLTAAGRDPWAQLCAEAIRNGNEETLATGLVLAAYWNDTGTRTVKGKLQSYTINVQFEAERLARSEFNTWYVRGFSKTIARRRRDRV